MRGMLSPHDRSALRFAARHLAMGLAAGAGTGRRLSALLQTV
jgi:hypothetical protein